MLQNQLYADAKTHPLQLSKEESEFLTNHPTITLGADASWQPFDFKDSDGKHAGFNADYLALLEQKLGVKFRVETGDWGVLQEKVRQKTLDGLVGPAKTSERQKYMVFTEPYFYVSEVILTKKSSMPITSLTMLEGKKLGVKESSSDIQYIKTHFPKINLVTFQSEALNIQALSFGDVDASLCNIGTASIEIEKAFISNVKIAYHIEALKGDMRFGVRDDWGILAGILQKAIFAVSEEEKRAIIGRWLQIGSKDKEGSSKIPLSPDEEEWIKEHKEFYYSETTWEPLVFIKDKQISGMIKDYLDLFALKTGLQFQYKYEKTWSDVLKSFELGGLDFVPGIVAEDINSTNHYSTSSYLTFPLAVIGTDEIGFINSLSQLDGKKVGVGNGYSSMNLLQKKYPNIKLVPFEDTQSGIRAVANHQVDVYVGLAPIVAHMLRTYGVNSIKIVGISKEELNLVISSDDSMFIQIMDKAIKSITPQERAAIEKNYIDIAVENKIDYTLLFEMIAVAFGVALLLLYSNYLLKQKVKVATGELRALLNSFNHYVIASKTDLEGRITYASDAFCAISGYTHEELIGQYHGILRHPDMPASLFKDLWKTLQEGKTWRGKIKNRTKDGGFYWVDAIISLDYDVKGKHIGYSAIRQDITAAKEVEDLKENLEIKIEERTQELNDERNFVDSVMNSQSNIVISTNGKTIISANRAFLEFFEVTTLDEFHTLYGACICDTFDKNAGSEYIQKFMGDEIWIDYIYIRPKRIHKTIIVRKGKPHTFTITADKFALSGQELQTAVFTDITELEATQKNVELILSNILLPVLITSKKERKIIYANKYAQTQYEKSLEQLIGSSIDDVYTMQGQHKHIIAELESNGYVENFEEVFKTSTGREFTALLSVTPIMYQEEDAYIGMVTDITKQKEMEQHIRTIHRHTTESIEYASLIQHALIPSNDLFRKYFSDYLTIWHPKDIVGGDLYLFEELRHDDECLLTVIDCTGHGVPGAFVTMLVKAIERQITGNIMNSEEIVSPAKILSIFNQNMKHLLKQDNEDSISNAGFDGAILYYNKSENIVKFSGAGIGLFVVKDGILEYIKGDRHSIGYKKSDANFTFTDHVIDAKKGMQFYITTDGYLDQNGGEYGFSFGKKRFSQLLQAYGNLPLADQQEILLYELLKYRNNEEKTDDVTIVGVKI